MGVLEEFAQHSLKIRNSRKSVDGWLGANLRKGFALSAWGGFTHGFSPRKNTLSTFREGGLFQETIHLVLRG